MVRKQQGPERKVENVSLGNYRPKQGAHLLEYTRNIEHGKYSVHVVMYPTAVHLGLKALYLWAR